MNDRLVPCGGNLCPADRMCFSATGTCEYQAAIDACADKLENDPCTFQTVQHGLCEQGRCREARCGDGVVDPGHGEVCDDGNADNADGCSSDCRSLELCGNGIIDQAAGEQCDDGNRIGGDGCQASCQLPYCGDGVTDTDLNEQCDSGAANTNAPDTCRPNCQLPHCGDGIRDILAGEVCDDGNQIAGDGCRPDCVSNETCGNGIVDFATGELCDDGNTRARDGCSGCQREVLQSRIFGAGPPTTSSAVAAYDAARDRVVLFGGFINSTDLTNETWEWDGVSWRRATPTETPLARYATMMTYDAARQRVVLFGGITADVQLLDDTWEWDGIHWKQLQPAQRPPARRDAVMAYDAARKRVVLHGGNSAAYGGVEYTDTWEWDGATWTMVATGPNATYGAMTYDPIRREMVLLSASGTWTFDGVTWTQKQSAPLPYEASMPMVFDASRGHAVFIGQSSSSEWDGASWSSVNGLPNMRIREVAAYDSARREIIVFGGVALPSYTWLADTWRRDGTAWSDATVPVQPPGRYHARATLDPVRDRVVLFGGEGSLLFNDTWEWDGRGWRQGAPTMQPQAREDHALAFDGTHVVLAGGRDFDAFSRVLGDTWSWDGTNWSPGSALDVTRWGHAMAYDSRRARIVLFGGSSTSPPSQHDDGTLGWTTSWGVLTQQGPVSRHHAAMAYDPLRDRVVLYGGVTSPGAVESSTWEFDGATATWTQAEISAAPKTRKDHSLSFDPRRGRVVMYGASVTSPSRADIWEWTGTSWIERTIVPAVSARYRPTAVVQPSTGEIVVFGGRRGTARLAETTLIGYVPNTVTESCTAATIDYDHDGLYGCADDDCSPKCAPLCVPGTSCTTSPRCGDSVCDPGETCRLCPGDCGACAGDCGDFFCDPPETVTTCPADCP